MYTPNLKLYVFQIRYHNLLGKIRDLAWQMKPAYI